MKNILFLISTSGLLFATSNIAKADANPYATGITVLPNVPNVGAPAVIAISVGNGNSATSGIASGAVEWTVNVPAEVSLNGMQVGAQFGNTPFYLYDYSTGINGNKIILIRTNIAMPGSTVNNISDRIFILNIPIVGTSILTASAVNMSVNMRIVEGFGSTGNLNSNDDNATGTIQFSSPVPLTLLGFTGNSNVCDVNLEWTTTKEEAFNYFEIEQSEDAKRFQSIAKIKGGNVKYSYDTKQQNSEGYYRLKLMDLNGTFSYSDVIKVSTDCNNAIVKVFPNPVTTQLQVQGVAVGSTVTLVNVLGQKLWQQQMLTSETAIDMQKLTPGNYNLVVTSEQGISQNFKVVKH